MRLIKKLIRMTETQSGSEKIVSVSMIPLTVLILLTCPETPALNALSIILNVVLLVMAFVFEAEDD